MKKEQEAEAFEFKRKQELELQAFMEKQKVEWNNFKERQRHTQETLNQFGQSVARPDTNRLTTVLKSGLRILVRAPEVLFSVPSKWLFLPF